MWLLNWNEECSLTIVNRLYVIFLKSAGHNQSWLIKDIYSPDCIPVVVLLSKFEPELSYVLTELFNMCLKKSCFPGCLKVWYVDHVFKNVGERYVAKDYRPVTLLSVVSKIFGKLVNNRIVDHLNKCSLFWLPVWFKVYGL